MATGLFLTKDLFEEILVVVSRLKALLTTTPKTGNGPVDVQIAAAKVVHWPTFFLQRGFSENMSSGLVWQKASEIGNLNTKREGLLSNSSILFASKQGYPLFCRFDNRQLIAGRLFGVSG